MREQLQSDYAGTIRQLAEIGFRNVEPAGFPGSSPEEAARLFTELGISAPSCHCKLPLGDESNEVIETALRMGHRYLVTGCPPRFKEHYTGRDAVKDLAEQYCRAAEVAAEHGLQVGYHNHDWDLCEIDGQPAYRIFLAETPDDVLYEADLFWVARAGLDPVALVTELGARGRLLHCKDGAVDQGGTFVEAETADGKVMLSDAEPFLPAGTGQVPLRACVAAAAHCEYAAVELDSYPGDMLEAVAESYRYLTGNGIAVGAQ